MRKSIRVTDDYRKRNQPITFPFEASALLISEGPFSDLRPVFYLEWISMVRNHVNMGKPADFSISFGFIGQYLPQGFQHITREFEIWKLIGTRLESEPVADNNF